MNTTNCILCNNNSFVKLFTKDRWDIVRCDNCNLTFVNPLPTEPEIEAFYNNYANESSEERISKYLQDKRSRLRKNRRKLKLLEKIQGGKGRILDIGCGLGLFVKNASDVGWIAYGVDFDRDLVEYGKKTFNINLHCGMLEKAKFPSEYFNVITMFNLLDHIREPVVFLKEVGRILKRGGIIYLNVHDVMGWKAQRYGKQWGAYCPPGHLYYYSYETLRKLLSKTGLRFLMVPGVNLKEGIKMLIVKEGDPRRENYIREKFEKIIYCLVQIFKL